MSQSQNEELIPSADVLFAENPEQRCPCILLLDTSGSMGAESDKATAIQQLNDEPSLSEKQHPAPVAAAAGGADCRAPFPAATPWRAPVARPPAFGAAYLLRVVVALAVAALFIWANFSRTVWEGLMGEWGIVHRRVTGVSSSPKGSPVDATPGPSALFSERQF